LSVTHKYYLIQDERNWTDARSYCQSTHTDLAVIKSNEDMIQLQNEADIQQFSSYAWIGMYMNMYGFHWTYGDEPLGSLMFWEDGEPNNSRGDQNCVVITPWGWDDLECYEYKPYICFDETKTGSDRYIYNADKREWTDAQTYCRQYYTDLASAKDENENSLIQSIISGRTWIGLIKDGWKWVDQTNFSYVTWISGEPNNYWKNENCGYLEMGEAGDSQCSDIMPFFCYAETKTGSDRYIYNADKREWTDAQTYCRQYYTDLASAKDENENALIQSIIPGGTWFGLIKDGWQWVDQTNFSYVTWTSGEPDNYYWNENCGYLEMGEAGDSQCTEIMPFFCY
ncbi:macrophage mannose receptor 1-like isoform X2, partial [Silurus meridionalis]